MPITAQRLTKQLEQDVMDYLDESRDPVCNYAVNNLLRTLTGKLVSQEAPDAESKAYALFHAFNERSRLWKFSVETPRVKQLSDQFSWIAYQLDCELADRFSYTACFTRGYAGPGKSANVDKLNFFEKFFESPLTTSHPFLYDMYRSLTSVLPSWSSAEEQRFNDHGCTVLQGSKMSTVAKKNDIRRTICSEPSLDMFFQLGAGNLIRDFLKERFGCDLRTQPFYNRGLARRGSIDGSFGTIDASNASDSLSMAMLSKFFPRCSAFLSTLRSSKSYVQGDLVDLHMISTMGNGFTFPLMTLVLLTVVNAVYILHGFASTRSGKIKKIVLPCEDGQTLSHPFGVFGDDVIVTRECYDDTIILMEHLGFVVNVDKSYNDGSFRESCGGDFINGLDVRGVYIKSLATPQDRYSAANRLLAFSARWGFTPTRTVRYLLDGMPNRYVPIHFEITSGLRCPLWAAEPGPVFTYWQARPRRELVHGDLTDALFVCALAGYLRSNKDGQCYRPIDGPYGSPTSYSTRRMKTNYASWDSWPSGAGFSSQREYMMWEHAVVTAITAPRSHKAAM
jgi:hypothetical protein